MRAIERVLGRKIEQHIFDNFNYAIAAPTPPTRNIMKIATHKPMRQKHPNQRNTNQKNKKGDK